MLHHFIYRIIITITIINNNLLFNVATTSIEKKVAKMDLEVVVEVAIITSLMSLNLFTNNIVTMNLIVKYK